MANEDIRKPFKVRILQKWPVLHGSTNFANPFSEAAGDRQLLKATELPPFLQSIRNTGRNSNCLQLETLGKRFELQRTNPQFPAPSAIQTAHIQHVTPEKCLQRELAILPQEPISELLIPVKTYQSGVWRSNRCACGRPFSWTGLAGRFCRLEGKAEQELGLGSPD